MRAPTDTMTPEAIDLSSWDRAEHFHFFRAYARPHYAVTCRLDASHLMARRHADRISPFRACLHAMGAGLNASAALRTRFRGDEVVRHDRIGLSITVPREREGFAYAYLPWQPDFAAFDRDAAGRMEAAAKETGLKTSDVSGDGVAYLSCLPWMDFTALDHAVPDADDCIPRVSWGKIVEEDGRHRVAVNIQVHHALVHGADLGQFYQETQTALNAL